MTKAQVAARLTAKIGLSQKQSSAAVDVFVECVKNALRNGENVTLVGFGTFYLKERNARNGRNPRTGEAVRIPAKRVVAFKPGKAFREAVKSLPLLLDLR